MALEITTQRAREFGVESQGKDEDDFAFRHRVAGALREKGYIIEAHEAQTNRLYDDPGDGMLDDPMTGIMGAMAQVLHGIDFRPRDGVHQVGDDMAVGAIVRSPKRDMDPATALLMIAMMGDKR